MNDTCLMELSFQAHISTLDAQILTIFTTNFATVTKS